METKHTQGPWQIKRYANGGNYLIETDAATVAEVLDDVWTGEEDSGEQAANARLIAASPDLLAACMLWDQGFVDGEEFTHDQFVKWVNDNRRAARAAIAKATQPITPTPEV